MKSQMSWRTRIAAAVAVVALGATGLALESQTAVAAQQNGTNNYAGPKPCPQAGFDSCVNPAASEAVTQSSSGGHNVYEASVDGGTVTQNNTTGANDASCNLQTTAATSTQTCNFTQTGDGGNSITATVSASPSVNTTGLGDITQSSSQTLIANQSSNTGDNFVGSMSTPAAFAINQQAQQIVSPSSPVHHKQETFELLGIRQVASSSGNNTANLKLDRTQNTTARGLTPDQKQDTGTIPTSASCNNPVRNGNACVYQRTGTGMQNLKIRAADTKTETGRDLSLAGAVTQTQGQTAGGWLIEPDVDSLGNPNGTNVDLGPQDGSDGGVTKNWTQVAQNALGQNINGPNNNQLDDLKIPIIGKSPCNAKSFEGSKITGPPQTRQVINITALGHSKCGWTGRLKADADAATPQTQQHAQYDFTNQNFVNANVHCTNNIPNSCASLSGNGQDVNTTEGSLFSGPVAQFAYSGSSAPTFNAPSIDWGEGQTTSGEVTGGNGTYVVSGTHTYADEGTYTVITTLSTTDGAVTATATTAANVADAPLTATGTTLFSQTTSVSNVVVGTFTDANPGAPASDFTAKINWGDGTDPTDGAISGSAGAFSVSGSHAYPGPGRYTITPVITDKGGSTATPSPASTLQTSTAAVTAVNINGVEGAAFSGPVGSFTDANTGDQATDFTAKINWGDGPDLTDGTISGSAGAFSVSGSHTYADEKSPPHVVTLTVTSAHDALIKGSASSSATIGDAPLTASGKTLSAAGNALNNVVVATFTDANPGATTNEFTATINWGDGSSSGGTVGAGFTVSGSHTYNTGGLYNITTTINDVGGSTASATSTFVTAKCPAGGCFTIGDKSTTGTVEWWGSDWSTKNQLTGGPAPSSFKGFENTIAQPTTCGASAPKWGTSGGNSPPPSSGIPQYMLVIVTSSVTKSSSITGNILKIVIVKTNPGYSASPSPGSPGTGTVVATICG